MESCWNYSHALPSPTEFPLAVTRIPYIGLKSALSFNTQTPSACSGIFSAAKSAHIISSSQKTPETFQLRGPPPSLAPSPWMQHRAVLAAPPTSASPPHAMGMRLKPISGATCSSQRLRHLRRSPTWSPLGYQIRGFIFTWQRERGAGTRVWKQG